MYVCTMLYTYRERGSVRERERKRETERRTSISVENRRKNPGDKILCDAVLYYAILYYTEIRRKEP